MSDCPFLKFLVGYSVFNEEFFQGQIRKIRQTRQTKAGAK